MSDECKSEVEWIRSISARYNGYCSYAFASKVFYLMNKNLNKTHASIKNYFNGTWRYPGSLNTTQLICSGYIRLNCNNINKKDIYNDTVINTLNNYYALSVKKERKEYDDIASKVRDIENDYWYPISKTWWDTWVEYTQYGINDKDIPGGYMYMERRSAPKPGKIDNSALQDMALDDPKLIKINTIQEVDYIWLHYTEWNYLYGLYSGGPVFPRQLYKENGELKFAKTLKPYVILYVNPDCADINFFDCNYYKEWLCPQRQLIDIVKRLIKKRGYDDNFDVKGFNELNIPYFRIWLMFRNLRFLYLHNFNLKRNDLLIQDPNRWVELPKNSQFTLDEIEQKSKEIVYFFAIEFVEKGKYGLYWPTKEYNTNPWYHFKIGQMVRVLTNIHENRWYEGVIKQVLCHTKRVWIHTVLIVHLLQFEADIATAVYDTHNEILLVRQRLY
mmetsp:Transcript_56823/g.69441  ORF Transcript_56823/g.69441 Transcript_56823/m.69441 type:complete len:444 (+) Transcript_56823:40-1371(+)